MQRLQKAQQTFATNVKSSLEKLRTLREDSREDREDSREHIEQKEIRILKELAALSKEEDIQLSQQRIE